jgi:uncharacterized membrane protein YhaH (DUF805 family)
MVVLIILIVLFYYVGCRWITVEVVAVVVVAVLVEAMVLVRHWGSHSWGPQPNVDMATILAEM